MTTTEYLLKTREYQLNLDALLQSAIKNSFNNTTLTTIRTNVTNGINALRTIELKLFQALSQDYTYTPYNSNVAYMTRVQLPQLFHQTLIKSYYLTRLQEIVDDVVSVWEAESTFVGDQTGLTNQLINKGGTWTGNQTTLVTALDNLITAIESDNQDNS